MDQAPWSPCPLCPDCASTHLSGWADLPMVLAYESGHAEGDPGDVGRLHDGVETVRGIPAVVFVVR